MRGMGIVVSQARGGSKGTRVAERLGPVRGWIARRIVRERWPISGHERAVRFARIERLVIWFLVGLLAAHVLDEPAWRWARLRDEAWLEDRDWYQVLRQMGYLPVWIVLGVAYGLQDLWRRRRGGRDCGPRSVMLILSPLIAGVIAEVLKRTIGRERPPEFPVMAIFEDDAPMQRCMQSGGEWWRLDPNSTEGLAIRSDYNFREAERAAKQLRRRR